MIGTRPHASLPTPATRERTVAGSVPVAVGPARLRELPAIAGLQRRAFPPRLAYTLGTLAFLWALPWVRVLVARRDGEIVGCVIGDRVLEGVRVVNLAVDPVVRRQGIGTKLLDAVERALPAGDMTLMVQAENAPARALYRRAGYQEIKPLANYYGPGRAGIWMRKRREKGALR
jgi:ribosomal-protein-alanine N-acetyltransferase